MNIQSKLFILIYRYSEKNFTIYNCIYYFNIDKDYFPVKLGRKGNLGWKQNMDIH
jgi:hypothetical protein